MRTHRFGHTEHHKSERIGWLRAAVLGANDGIISTASLVIGVAAANTDRSGVMLSGLAGLVAGAMSMAAGEYVSVSSQADTELADLAREKNELATNPRFEAEELAQIYIKRGLPNHLAHQVADQLMASDSLKSHARDELGITESGTARPIQAALASAATFSIGAMLPLSTLFFFPSVNVIGAVYSASLLFLVLLGALAAWVGGASLVRGATRVAFWGALAMAVTACVGKLFGTVVG